MARTLKVFSTSAGFYEAVVAAPSRKAALAACGVHDDLFASDAAKEVDDPKLREAALARPGQIVRVPIALDASLVATAGQPRTDPKPAKPKPSPEAAAPAKPPPDRTALMAAEAALGAAEEDRDRRAAELAEARRSLEVREAAVKCTTNAAVRAASVQVDFSLGGQRRHQAPAQRVDFRLEGKVLLAEHLDRPHRWAHIGLLRPPNLKRPLDGRRDEGIEGATFERAGEVGEQHQARLDRWRMDAHGAFSVSEEVGIEGAINPLSQAGCGSIDPGLDVLAIPHLGERPDRRNLDHGNRAPQE